MYEVWEQYFNDVPRKNFVLVTFGKHAKRQLGSIKYANEKTKVQTLLKRYREDIYNQDINSISVILLTRYFKDENVPEFVLISTMAHEICHYAHGFHSPLPKKYKYPHKGNVVKKEMITRNLEDVLNRSDKWLKDNWADFVYRY